MNKDEEIHIILEAVSEYLHDLIENHDGERLFFRDEKELAHEESEWIVERLEGLLEEQWH